MTKKIPKRFKRMSITVIAVTAVIMICLLSFFQQEKENGQPVAKNGAIDFSGWDFQKHGLVKLNGEWEFYPDQLLTPTAFSSASQPKQADYITVPSLWNQSFDGLSDSACKFGTYRLRITGINQKMMLGLAVNDIKMSSKVYVNGIFAGGSGNPTIQKKKGYIAANVPFATYLSSESGTGGIEIIIQVSNFNYLSGGIAQSIYFGTSQEISMQMQQKNFLNSFVSAAVFITGLYFLLIYLGRRKERGILYYSIYAISLSFFMLLYDRKIEIQMFRSLESHFVQFVAIHNILISITVICMLMFVQEMNGGLSKYFVRGIVTVYAAYIGLNLILPLEIASHIQNPMLLFGMMIYLAVISILLNSLANKRYGALPKQDILHMVISFAFVLVYFLVEVLYLNNIIYSKVIGYCSMLLFIGSISMLISRQYNKSYRTIEQLNKRLLDMDALKDDFLEHTSHELKIPLNGIMHLTSTVLKSEKGQLSNGQLENLQLVMFSCRRLENLINDISDMLCLKQGELKLNFKAVDLKSVTTTVLHVMRYMEKGKAIEFRNQVPDLLPFLYGDEERIYQILFNLIENALKYTQSGSVTVGAEYEGNGGNVRLWVEDTGCGIMPEDQKHIFEPFYHPKAKRSKDVKGTGLELFLARKLIQLQEGDLTFVSEPGKGSIFSFTLPAHASRKTASAFRDFWKKKDYLKEVSLYEADPATMKNALTSILIADDDKTTRKIISSLLQEEGRYICSVSDGIQALDAVMKEQKFDLVILDVMMPGFTGLEVLEKIRTRYSAAQLPVLLMTSKARQEDIQVAFGAGANDHLVKPFEAEELKARAETLLQLKTSIDATLSSELSFLQAQIKPHFLYNALSVISSLCIREPKRAKELLLYLSDYLRGSFQFDNHGGGIRLETEMRTVEAYLAIEQARFQERLIVKMNVHEGAVGDIMIPILSVQPLVENAVRHGIMGKLEGGTVGVEVSKVNNNLVVKISDNGVGIPKERLLQIQNPDFVGKRGPGKAGGVGLRNIQKRMAAMYEGGLEIESSVGVGTTITLTIPISYGCGLEGIQP